MDKRRSVSAINESRIDHKNWCQALTDLHTTMIAAQPGEVVCVAGPSRVGKTKLIVEVEKIVAGQDGKTGTKPIVSILTRNASHNGYFDTKTFNGIFLDKLEHPVYAYSHLSLEDAARVQARYDRTPVKTVDTAIKLAIKCREVKYLVVDEAQHVKYAKGGEKVATAIMDSWKGLAQETGVVLVLVGTYDLLNVISLSTHMIGRKLQVHFPPYRQTKEDIERFEQVLETYSDILSAGGLRQNLRQWNELLYYGTLGCVGRLSIWLRAAIVGMDAAGRGLLDHDLLIKHMSSEYELELLRQEIKDGEDYFLRKEEKRFRPEVSTRKKATEKRKPFTKKPKRYAHKGRV